MHIWTTFAKKKKKKKKRSSPTVEIQESDIFVVFFDPASESSPFRTAKTHEDNAVGFLRSTGIRVQEEGGEIIHSLDTHPDSSIASISSLNSLHLNSL